MNKIQKKYIATLAGKLAAIRLELAGHRADEQAKLDNLSALAAGNNNRYGDIVTGMSDLQSAMDSIAQAETALADILEA